MFTEVFAGNQDAAKQKLITPMMKCAQPSGGLTQADADAVVVGSGPNGLVAANLLADAGWDVLVLEAQPEYGGAVRSDARRAPGLRARHVQLVLPAGVGLPGDARRWSSRSTGSTGRTRRPSSARRCPAAGGPSCTATAEDTAAGLEARHPRRRRRVAAALRDLGPGRRRPRRRADDAVPAGPARCPRPATPARPGRADPAPRRRSAPVRGWPGASSAATPRGCCCSATPPTATWRSARPGSGVDGPAARDDRAEAGLPRPHRRRRLAVPGAGRPAAVAGRPDASAAPGSSGCWSGTAGRGACGPPPGTSSGPGGRCSPTCPRPRCTAAWCPGTTCPAGPAA